MVMRRIILIVILQFQNILNLERSSFYIYQNQLFYNNDQTETSAESTLHQRPKWAIQVINVVHPDEVNKTGTRISSTQEPNDASFASTKPDSFSKAMKQKEQKESMLSEYNSILENSTWKLVDCPSNVKPRGCKWVYQIKYKSNGEVDKYKERIVDK